MKKKLKIILLLLLLPLFVFGCGKKQQASEEKQREAIEGPAMMWEVTSSETNAKLYLLGSIHIAKKELYPLNKTITNAFNNSNSLIVEVDTIAFENNREAVKKISEDMIYSDGTTIEDHISDSALELLNERVENGGIKGILKGYEYYYKPMALYSVLANEIYESYGYKSQYGIDEYLLKEAKKKNMEIIELETAEFQYDVLFNLPDPIQSAMLESALAPKESEKELFAKLFDAWEKGDVEAFKELSDKSEEEDRKSLNHEDEKYYLEYQKALIDDRNATMVEKAIELLKGDKTYFYVVGSAHMIGDNGIIQALIDKGYKVEKK